MEVLAELSNRVAVEAAPAVLAKVLVKALSEVAIEVRVVASLRRVVGSDRVGRGRAHHEPVHRARMRHDRAHRDRTDRQAGNLVGSGLGAARAVVRPAASRPTGEVGHQTFRRGGRDESGAICAAVGCAVG